MDATLDSALRLFLVLEGSTGFTFGSVIAFAFICFTTSTFVHTPSPGEALREDRYSHFLKICIVLFFGVFTAVQVIHFGYMLNNISDANVWYVTVGTVITITLASLMWPIRFKLARALGHS